MGNLAAARNLREPGVIGRHLGQMGDPHHCRHWRRQFQSEPLGADDVPHQATREVSESEMGDHFAISGN